MNHATRTILVAVSACFSAQVAVCSLQGPGADAQRGQGRAEARASAAGQGASDATGSGEMAHIIGDVLLPPQAEKAIHFYPVLPSPH